MGKALIIVFGFKQLIFAGLSMPATENTLNNYISIGSLGSLLPEVIQRAGIVIDLPLHFEIRGTKMTISPSFAKPKAFFG